MNFSDTMGISAKNIVLGILDTTLEFFKGFTTNKTPTQIAASLLAGLVILLIFVYVFLNAQWFFAFAAWWACSELTKIRVTMQEADQLWRRNHD